MSSYVKETRPTDNEDRDIDYVIALPEYQLKLKTETDATATFQYNYYTVDEGTSEITSLSSNDRSTDQYNFVLENYENGTLPRQVQLSFITKFSSPRTLPRLPQDTLKNAHTEKKIIYEESPFSPSYATIGVYDTSIDEKIYNISQVISSSLDNDSGFLSSTKQQAVGIRFSKSQASEKTVNLYSNDVKAKTMFSTYSSLFISDIIRSAARWQSSAYVDEYASLFSYAANKQSVSRIDAIAANPLQITEEECDIDLPTLEYVQGKKYGNIKSFEANDSFKFNDTTKVGYIIEKYGEQLDGTTLKYEDIVLQNASITTFVDTNVRYGGVYKYRIRPVFKKTVLCDGPDGITVPASIFIAATGAQTTVQCIEKNPPPPPNNISFQQTLDGLYIRWNFPINPQKDIKRFQVFRRKSITDPFELIQEINFDKSLLPYTTGESVPEQIVTISDGPIKHFLDTEFNKINSDYIYAICSIDAHGYTSNFSEQFRVRFDRINAKLLITRIATEGAPKSYPNVTILGDFFADLIKSSEKKRVRLYFDPEYTDVTKDGTSLNLIQTTGAGLTTHRLVLTELALAQNQSVDIVVGNKRIDVSGIPPAIGRFYTS